MAKNLKQTIKDAEVVDRKAVSHLQDKSKDYCYWCGKKRPYGVICKCEINNIDTEGIYEDD